jgi:hypothetical protein
MLHFGVLFEAFDLEKYVNLGATVGVGRVTLGVVFEVHRPFVVRDFLFNAEASDTHLELTVLGLTVGGSLD